MCRQIFACVLLLCFMPMLSAAPLVIAHRGASGYLPEHTLEAKTLAFAQGADYLEQDVVMSKDDVLMVFHDLTLERMTDVAQRYPGRAREDGSYYVIDFTLAELRELQVHEGTVATNGEPVALFAERFPINSGIFRLHTLEEELQLIAGLQVSTGRQVGIYPELKSPWFHHQEGKDLSTAVLTVLSRYGYKGPEDRVFLQSFDYPELLRVKQELMPRLHMNLPLVQLIAENSWMETMALDQNGHWLAYDFAWMLTPAGLQTLAATVAGVGPSISMLIAPELSRDQLPETLAWVEQAHDLKLQVHPYTFRRDPGQLPGYAQSLEDLLALFTRRYLVDGVFTDFPDIAVRTLHSVD